MKMATAAALLVLGAAACAEDDVPDSAGAASAVPDGVLGLSQRQTEDADIVDVVGRDLGDVERIVRGPDGAPTAVVVAVADTAPAARVTLPIEGLSIVETDGDWDLVTPRTREQLLGLPRDAG